MIGIGHRLPKNDRHRSVPLPDTVVEALREHLDWCKPVEITLPWEDPFSDERVTVPLVLTTRRKGAINRAAFDGKGWKPALTSGGVLPTRATGMHALRHFYASALLEAGESVKALASYLGHADPGFTLRVYTHLMPSSEQRPGRRSMTYFGALIRSAPEDIGSEILVLGQ